MYTEQITQAMGFASEVDPQTLNNGNKTAGGVDMSIFRRAIFIINVGTIAGAFTFQLQESNSANMAGATNLAGNNTSMTGYNTANSIVTFEARAGQMTKRYLGLKVTETASANSVVCVNAIGMEADHKPGNAQNVAAVNTQNVVS